MTRDKNSQTASVSGQIRSKVWSLPTVIVLSCLSTLTCQSALADAARERAAIIDTMQAWERAVEARNYEALESFYTEDAIHYPNNARPVVGRAGIIESNRRRGSDSVVDITQQVDEVSVNDNWALYSCLAKISISKPESQKKTERYVRVMLVMEKSAAGQWRIYRDIDNGTPERLETE